MTPERRAALRAVVEQATAGGRKVYSTATGHWAVKAGHSDIAVMPEATTAKDDAQHIAAFDRETCLALLDALDAAEAGALRLVHMLTGCGRNHEEPCAHARDLAAAVELAADEARDLTAEADTANARIADLEARLASEEAYRRRGTSS